MRTSHGLRAAFAGPRAGGWSLINASFSGAPVNSATIDPQASTESFRDIFFSPDGTKMYAIRSSVLYEYSLSTAWNVTTYSFVRSLTTSTQNAGAMAVFFKGDGTKMYTLGDTNDRVSEYNLSTAWDISTATWVQNFSVTTEATVPTGLFFKDDGTRMYVLDATGDDINEYSLSTAWDISTASYVQVFSVAAQDTVPTGLFFKPDGTKMYVMGDAGNDVNEYNLSTAWDISTASYVQVFSVGTQDAVPQGVFFKDDGSRMFVIGTTNRIYQYDLSTAWNVSTASYSYPTTDYLKITQTGGVPYGLHFKPDGTKMYTVNTGAQLDEYDLSTPWEIHTATFLQRLALTTTGQRDGVFFKPDGLTVYVAGRGIGGVQEYSLSTAWDISTASYVQFKGIGDGFVICIFIKPDGTRLYTYSFNVRGIWEYELSTPWDISTATFLRAAGSVPLVNIIYGLYFNPNGTRMFCVGANGDAIYEFYLPTPWVTTGSVFLRSIYVHNFDDVPQDLYINPDGSKAFICGSERNALWSFDL